jgi:hypothetical protein
MKHLFTIRFLLAFVLTWTNFLGNAQSFSVEWDFGGNVITPTYVSGPCTGASAAGGSGLLSTGTFEAISNRLQTSGWPTESTRQNTYYVEFRVIINAGQYIGAGKMITFSFNESESSGGVDEVQDMDIEVRLDGVSANFWNNENAVGNNNISISYTTPANTNATSLAFRIYGYNLQNTSKPDNWRFDNVSITGENGALVLPVTLTSFKGVLESGRVKLNWTTGASLRNDYMAVERSADSRNFREIGRVKGAGNSNETQGYEFIDEQPFAGANYYRLRQVDFDGAVEYSNIISVKNGRGAGGLTLSPNPAGAALRLKLSEAIREESRYLIFDAAGRMVLEGIFPAESTFETVNIGAIPPGFYNLRLADGSGIVSEKFYKQ